MKINFLPKIDDKIIAELPLKTFDKEIFIIDNNKKLEKAYDYLKKCKILGFDTETKPNFVKGKKNRNTVSLLQFSDDKKAFLIQIKKISKYNCLKAIFENPEIKIIGLAVKEDIRELKIIFNFIPENLIDLQDYVKYFGIEDNGLKKLTANILKFRISKRQQLSNWENDNLTLQQQQYAATDAWVCFEIYKKLNNTL